MALVIASLLRRRFVEAQAEEAAQGERIGRLPGDAVLRIDAFEVPDQQEAEVTCPVLDPAGQPCPRRMGRTGPRPWAASIDGIITRIEMG